MHFYNVYRSYPFTTTTSLQLLPVLPHHIISEKLWSIPQGPLVMLIRTQVRSQTGAMSNLPVVVSSKNSDFPFGSYQPPLAHLKAVGPPPPPPVYVRLLSGSVLCRKHSCCAWTSQVMTQVCMSQFFSPLLPLPWSPLNLGIYPQDLHLPTEITTYSC